jgi:hypothetical protein
MDIFIQEVRADKSGSSSDADGLHRLKKFLKDHPPSNPERSPEALSLAESIAIVVDIYWYFSDIISERMYLIDKFTCIFHTIHSEF